MGLYDILSRIRAKGYHPVLAHPERYVYMSESNYRKLKNMGVKFQLNIFSLVGLYGSEAKEKSTWLLQTDFYDLQGSDVHSREMWETATYEKKILERVVHLCMKVSGKSLF